jgi:hypothetical protein
MVTGDPQRTPTFVMFGNPDYFFQTSGTPTLQENNGFAWNHGGTNPEIVTTWLGLAGPGVLHQGRTHTTWSDHTDIRPTMLLLAGLTDDYAHDGVALVGDLSREALPPQLRRPGAAVLFQVLSAAYKQINAPVGALGMATLAVSTKALAGDDTTYAALESALSKLTTQRDALAAQVIAQLEAAEFGGQAVGLATAANMIAQAAQLVSGAQNPTP